MDNKDNTEIKNELVSKCKLKTFLDCKELFEELKSRELKDQKEILAITSDKSGPELASLLTKDKITILGIVIFCMNVEYHKTWASKYVNLNRRCDLEKG